MISYRADTIRQRPPAPKQEPKAEPISKRHATASHLTKTKRDLAERDAKIKALHAQNDTFAEIARQTGYANAGGVQKRLIKLGLIAPRTRRGSKR